MLLCGLIKAKKEEKEEMKVYWNNKNALTGLYELRVHPVAMLLKLRKVSGGSWIVNCLGEVSELPSELNDEQAKKAAIKWFIPVLKRLRESLDAFYK